MTQSGDPLENAMAERINGILKEEYMDTYKIKDLADAKAKLNKAINLYNTDRPHLSIGMYTPEKIHQNPNIKFKKVWKNYYSKNYTVNPI